MKPTTPCRRRGCASAAPTPTAIENLGGWLTTVVARVCLDMLRSRNSRREESLSTAARLTRRRHQSSRKQSIPNRKLSSPIPSASHSSSFSTASIPPSASPSSFTIYSAHRSTKSPKSSAALPKPRANSPAALDAESKARLQLPAPNSRSNANSSTNLSPLFAPPISTRSSALLDPDIAVHVDEASLTPGVSRETRGAAAWAKQAITAARGARFANPVLVDGNVGVVVAPKGRLFRVLRFTFANDKIAAIEVIGDPEVIQKLDLAVAPE